MTLARKSRSKSSTPSNISGSLSVWGAEGKFTSLKEPKGFLNAWLIPKISWNKKAKEVLESNNSCYDFHREGEQDHEIQVTEVKDDNGNPFITFFLDLGRDGGGAMTGMWLGRKVVDGEKERPLSKAERKRLNWDVDEEDLQAMFRRLSWSETRDRALQGGSVSN